MAFVQTPNDPNAQQPGSQSTSMNQLPVTASGSGAGAAGANTTPAGGASAVPASTQAPPVQDLKAYLAANAPQAVGMGQTIAGGLNQEYQTAAGDINAAKTAQDQAVQAGSVTPNADLVSQAAENPTQFVENPQNIQDFLAQENATYTGPTADTATSAINAVNIPTAPDINQPGGVRQLVTGMETNPTYGMENLDELIMQGNPEALAPVQAALPQFQTLAGQQTAAATSEQNAIAQATADAEASQAGVANAFTAPGGVVPTFQAGVNQELTNDVGQANTYNEGLNSLISALGGAQPDLVNLKNAVSGYNSQIAPTENIINNALSTAVGDADAGMQFGPGVPSPDQDVSTDEAILAGMGNPLTVQNLPSIPEQVGLPTINQAATPQDIAEQNALETLLGSNFTPNFNATGQTTFQSPGNAPTASQEIDAILSDLQNQPQSPYVGGSNLGNVPARFTPPVETVWNPGSIVGVNSAENALQQYLAQLSANS